MDIRKKNFKCKNKKLIKSSIDLEQENYLCFILCYVMQLNYIRNLRIVFTCNVKFSYWIYNLTLRFTSTRSKFNVFTQYDTLLLTFPIFLKIG